MKLVLALSVLCTVTFAGDQGNGGLYCNPNEPATQCCNPNDQTPECGSNAASSQETNSLGDTIFYFAEELGSMAMEIADGVLTYGQ
jgi:hypothetical protein